MEKEIVKTTPQGMLQDSLLNTLADDITDLIEKARASSINLLSAVVVQTYWNIGKHIVEFEQNGSAKAKYGSALLTNLSKILTIKLGAGYSRPNLNNMRKFFLLYPNLSDVSNKLTWSHICELVKIDDDLERSFYEKECIAEKWNVRSLRRQMESGLFLRLAASKDKAGILKLAKTGVEIQKPEDIVKDTYTLEFLGLPEMERYSESDLEQRIIDNLQTFLLELGKGFAFIGRQVPLDVGEDTLYADLLFYHLELRCFVVVELKTTKFKPEYIGQLGTYVSAVNHIKKKESDNPTVGLLICKEKNNVMAQYALESAKEPIGIAEYKLASIIPKAVASCLPTIKEIEKELEKK